jgi:hypothetical protein
MPVRPPLEQTSTCRGKSFTKPSFTRPNLHQFNLPDHQENLIDIKRTSLTSKEASLINSIICSINQVAGPRRCTSSLLPVAQKLHQTKLHQTQASSIQPS